jgi:hypothetical protein
MEEKRKELALLARVCVSVCVITHMTSMSVPEGGME